MCIANRHLTRKARIFLAIGNICLFTSIVLAQVGHGVGAAHPNLFSGVRGFLLGLSIVFNFQVARLSRRPKDGI